MLIIAGGATRARDKVENICSRTAARGSRAPWGEVDVVAGGKEGIGVSCSDPERGKEKAGSAQEIHL